MAFLAACGELERDNPFDPRVSEGEALLRTQILGEWELDEDGENQVYVFRADGSVERRDYSAPGGGLVERGAPFPQTLVISRSGTYGLEGKNLSIVFTQIQTNEPAGVPPPLDPDGLLLRLEVRGDRLTFSGDSRERSFTRLF
jgi:hypothetical protein